MDECKVTQNEGRASSFISLVFRLILSLIRLGRITILRYEVGYKPLPLSGDVVRGWYPMSADHENGEDNICHLIKST